MQIAVVGLGLIGGSIAKAMKTNTQHTVYGADLQPSIVWRAKLLEAIDGELTEALLPQCDIVIVALYPADTVSWLRAHADRIRGGALVVDCCGVKQPVCDGVRETARQHGFTFIGGHPMAGIERSGFEHSQDTLFRNASMILTPEPDIDIAVLERAKKFFLSIGFGRITIRTAAEHDQVIAYTSQLAHVLSSAYIGSPTAERHSGLSAGSFQDMTRVATLNAPMWRELFLDNRENLIAEIDGLIARLKQYGDALRASDAGRLEQLLREGAERKARCAKEGE